MLLSIVSLQEVYLIYNCVLVADILMFSELTVSDKRSLYPGVLPQLEPAALQSRCYVLVNKCVQVQKDKQNLNVSLRAD